MPHHQRRNGNGNSAAASSAATSFARAAPRRHGSGGVAGSAFEGFPPARRRALRTLRVDGGAKAHFERNRQMRRNPIGEQWTPRWRRPTSVVMAATL